MQRKTVTVLFCDVTGSTALGESVDPEALRALLARYFERMKSIIERHGGTVEKFIGDAVMAVFGIPAAHEDDALRAVRAAAEMRDALPGLGIHARIGVNTGEVVTGTEERLATGDAVNVAARLEQAAHPDEVLIGASTLALVRDAAEIEPVDPLTLKGKTEPVAAYRLLRVGAAPERRHDQPFVGRQSELALLRMTWERAKTARRCELLTVIGGPGVGKSRLVSEFLRSAKGTVMRGRCLPYGEGITYWPVVEVLKELGVLPAEEAAAAAIRSLLGETTTTIPTDTIAWAVRKSLEQAARERPVVVVFDDIHWGEETFLDLIEHIALLSSGAAILLLCMARPELSDRRPSWPVTLRLEPLPDAEVAELIPERIAGTLRERIARAAGGNPLFISEMVSMADTAKGEVVVPPTLQALLGARLDQLDPPERSVLERGAVEGEVFHRGAVQALAPEETHVTRRLASLVRRELIRPDAPQFPGEDGFRFRHLLIRDAAYDSLPKALRADLHERLARWLEEHGAGLVELDEIVGYHFERACRYRAELGSPIEDELRTAAQRRLAAAGQRAYARYDYRAAIGLFDRAARLLAKGAIDVALETVRLDALFETGKTAEAIAHADALAERAHAAGDRAAELCARIQAALFRVFVEPEGATERVAALVDEAMPVLEAAGSDVALYIAYYARAQIAVMGVQLDAMVEALDNAIAHAGQAGLNPLVSGWSSTGRVFGTTPVASALAWLDEEEARQPWNVLVRRTRAPALAMLGRFDEARAILASARAELADRGGHVQAAVTDGILRTEVELLAGDPAAAALIGEDGCRLLGELGERSFRSTAVGWVARAYYELERLDDADRWAGQAAELGARDDLLTQMFWRQVRAKVLARRGDLTEAERLAREAVAIGEPIQAPNWQGDSYADLGEVLWLVGRKDEAIGALGKALERYERKGNLVMVARMRARRSQLGRADVLRVVP